LGPAAAVVELNDHGARLGLRDVAHPAVDRERVRLDELRFVAVDNELLLLDGVIAPVEVKERVQPPAHRMQEALQIRERIAVDRAVAELPAAERDAAVLISARLPVRVLDDRRIPRQAAERAVVVAEIENLVEVHQALFRLRAWKIIDAAAAAI